MNFRIYQNILERPIYFMYKIQRSLTFREKGVAYIMPLAARTHKKQWVIRPQNKNAAELAKALNVSPLLAQILLNRGISSPADGSVFLRPKLTWLIRPELMPGVQKAVERIHHAIKNSEKITIYGDYDVDGITGVAIIWQLLELLGADIDYYIPHRIDEGYGLNDQAVRSIAKAGTKLLITVDCGISAVESARLAEKLGLDLIITDHHQPSEKLPPAMSIVHPALDDEYSNPNSSGAMVAFKLAWAVADTFSSGDKLDTRLREFMVDATTLAAMGTLADLVDLRGENRILTSFGLKALPNCRLPGIRALIESANLTGKGLESYHIGFRLAPMINAAGRMGHARLAVEMLTSTNQLRAAQIAEYLRTQNTKRQKREKQIFNQACEMISSLGFDHPDHKTIVLANEKWHTGIIGIVASRLSEKFYRPTIMINIGARSRDLAQGSARSVPGFSILDAIACCSKHLISFGGHHMAAGITIRPENIPYFAADFEDYAGKNIEQQDTIAKIYIDAEAPLSGFRHETVKELAMLEPFGEGNPKPVFATKGVRLAGTPRKVGSKGEHLQLAITDSRTAVRCIGFRFGKWEKKLLDYDFFNVAYQPQINNYNGAGSVEFVLQDIQFE